MDTLTDKVEKFVINFLNVNLNTSFVYHNLTHTQSVVKKTNELANLSKLRCP